MKDWIQKNIDPPGIEKKNRGSLFSVIGRVFESVKNDAEKAFKAHFPYLADMTVLHRHGKSLGIPELPNDSEEEYRERVSTASFFLSRAGERGYILEQMRRHFGENFVLKEEFLRLYLNIAEMSEADRGWVHSLLDELLNPNISLTIAEWFHFIEELPMNEIFTLRAKRKDSDSFGGQFVCNGQFYCDHGKEILCDGTWECNDTIHCDAYFPVIGTVSDYIIEEVIADGSRVCSGSFNCSGHEEVYSPMGLTEPLMLSGGMSESLLTTIAAEPFEDRMQVDFICNGSFLCNGTNTDSIVDGPMTLRIIKELRCDGMHTPWALVCDGSIICDGSYSDCEGPYYSGDVIISEEVII